jgi:hypothetical protein
LQCRVGFMLATGIGPSSLVERKVGVLDDCRFLGGTMVGWCVTLRVSTDHPWIPHWPRQSGRDASEKVSAIVMRRGCSIVVGVWDSSPHSGSNGSPSAAG